MTYIILLAAGNSSRMEGHTKKQFLKISGDYVFELSLQKFQKWLPNAIIYMVIPKEDERWIKEKFESTKVKIISGGNTRTKSVCLALDKLSKQGKVLIHDAARPCLTQKIVLDVMDSIKKHGVGIPKIKLYDAIRKVNRHTDESIVREELFAIQTPQGFDVEKLKHAYNQNLEDAVDDASVYQRAGNHLHYVIGDPQNIKITEETSLEMVKKLLS